jgi:calcineurin-like phosphoesterase family protein
MHKRLKIILKPGQKAWFSSDWHLGHKGILAKDNRPFATIEDHDATIIQNWNDCIQDTEHIGFILGDLALTNKRRLDEYCCQIVGHNYYIQGNHDHSKDLKVIEKYFDVLSPLQEVEINGQLIVLCHYSLQVWNKHHRGAYHLFGHSHGSLKHVHGLKVDVGINNWFYRPVEYSTIKSLMEEKQIAILDHHVKETAE